VNKIREVPEDYKILSSFDREILKRPKPKGEEDEAD
jgi:hypothetical protein